MTVRSARLKGTLDLGTKTFEVMNNIGVEECGAFIGARVIDAVVNCPNCFAGVCYGCGEPALSMSEHHEVCIGLSTAAALAGPTEIPGLVRGKDFQICPSCGEGAELIHGCNAVWCVKDGIGYCYICGAETDQYSNHWTEGNPCPWYDQPGAANAQFDPEDDNDLDDESEDADDSPAPIATEEDWQTALAKIAENCNPVQQIFRDWIEALTQMLLGSKETTPTHR